MSLHQELRGHDPESPFHVELSAWGIVSGLLLSSRAQRPTPALYWPWDCYSCSILWLPHQLGAPKSTHPELAEAPQTQGAIQRDSPHADTHRAQATQLCRADDRVVGFHTHFSGLTVPWQGPAGQETLDLHGPGDYDGGKSEPLGEAQGGCGWLGAWRGTHSAQGHWQD